MALPRDAMEKIVLLMKYKKCSAHMEAFQLMQCIIMEKLAPGEIFNFYLVSVAVETGLSLALWETPKTGFLVTRYIYNQVAFSTSFK